MADPGQVLHNGVIHTMARDAADGGVVSALHLRDGWIVDAGDESLATAVPPARRTDLQGACVLPGFIDAHLHFEWFSLGLREIDADRPTMQRVLDGVAAVAASRAPGTWIRGHGWNHNIWGDGEWPRREQLDAVAPHHPVVLTAKSGHASWANSCALVAAGLLTDSHDRVPRADPPGGTILRHDDGRPTGVLLETASSLVDAVVPEESVQQVATAMKEGMAAAHALGITGVHDMDGVRSLRAWQQLRAEGALALRVCKTIPLDHLDEAIGCGMVSGFGDDRLWIGGVKIFTDGALGPQTAWMLEPYENDPANTGMPLIAPDELAAVMTRAADAGLASFVHAIGDRAIRMTLDVIEMLRARPGGDRLRHRIEHVQVIDPADVPRLAHLGVIASMQPIHATSDMHIVDRYWGPQRAPNAYAMASIQRAGATLAFGSDTPVEPIAPLPGIHAAITRRRADGSPGDEGWQPQERLDMHAAIAGFTRGAAVAGGQGAVQGRLAPGHWADLIVLDADPWQVDAMAIAGLRVQATMVGGQWVYRHADLAIPLD